jgi:hypothetical protein
MKSDRKASTGATIHGRKEEETASIPTSPTRTAAARQSTETSREKRPTDVEMIDGRPKDEFDRFTQSQKKRMTAIVSFSALLSRMSPTQVIGRANRYSNGILDLPSIRSSARGRS